MSDCTPNTLVNVPYPSMSGCGSTDGNQIGQLVPAGGTEGQHLAKASDGAFDVEWVDPPSGVDPALETRVSGLEDQIQDLEVASSLTLTNGWVLTYDSTLGKWKAGAPVVVPPGNGNGDMLSTTYDTNNNGVVDNSERLGGQLPSHYATATHNHAWGDITSGVPAAFPPSAHKASHSTGGADALTPADIGAATSGHSHSDATNSASGFMSAADKTKLNGIADGAQVNAVTSVAGRTGAVSLTSSDVGLGSVPNTDTTNAANITSGTLPAGRINDTSHGNRGGGSLHAAASTSTAGFMSAADKSKLDGIASGAQVNVKPDWNATPGDPNEILNKPTLGSAAASNTGDFAAATHGHAWGDITSGVPTTFTPSSHDHGSITNDGKIGSTAGLVVKTGADGAVTTLGMGAAGQVLKVNLSATDIEWGTDNTSSSGGDVATDTLWAAKGDLAVGTGSDTADRLPVGTNGQVLTADSNEATGVKWSTISGTGTVTSVGLSVPSSLLGVSGSPVTGSGTLAISLPNRDANEVFAGPTTGSAAAPSFRSLVAADIPDLAATKITSGQIPSAVTFDTGDNSGFSSAVAARLLEELPTDGGVLDIAQQSTLQEFIDDFPTDVNGNLDIAQESSVIALGDDIDAIEARSITAGTGLTGGGTLAASRTLAVDFATTATAGKAVEANDSRLSNERTPVDGSVSTAKIVDDAVTADKIADNAVGPAQIADAAVTMAKIAQAGATPNQVIKWNGTAWAPANDSTATTSGGAPVDAEYLVKASDAVLSNERVVTDSTSITADWATSGQVQLKRAALTGDVTADANSNTTTIANDAITTAKIADAAVQFAKIQAVAPNTILGNPKNNSDYVESISCTAAGRALLDDADAAAQRTTLELGSAATSSTSDFAPSAHTHAIKDSYVGVIEEATNGKTYTIDTYTTTARTITGIRTRTDSGTATITVKRENSGDSNFADVASGISVSSSLTNTTSLSNEAVAAGKRIQIEVTAASTPIHLAFVIEYDDATGAIS